MAQIIHNNEDLVDLYRTTRDEKYLQDLINQNKGLLNIWATSYVESIPNSEIEDLISESYIAMLRAIEDFESSLGSFANFLKTYVKQSFNRLYNEATRQKRYNGSTPVSYDVLTEINKEGGDEKASAFIVECEDIKSFEFLDFINSIELNEKERVAVTILMEGGKKGDVAKALKCTPATANYYFNSIRKKFIFAGVTV